jgi:uncharacterized protein (DUF58 family)
MRVTRRGLGAGLVGLFLVGFGLLLGRPVLIVGGALIGAAFLGFAVRFARQLERAVGGLSIGQRPDRDRVATDRDITVTVSAALEEAATVTLDIESQPPVATSIPEGAPPTTSLAIGDTHDETGYLASWPHAGTVTFEPARVTATDRLGLLRQRFGYGPSRMITVTAPAPHTIHVGIGGEPTHAGFGEHGSGRKGSGLEPAELRRYVPGDTAARIDWKTTARLAEPYVREFEIETDRRLVLIVDHRNHMNQGRPGETKLDYLREIALAYLESAEGLGDPLGCFTVGAEGITGRWPPGTRSSQYTRIRQHLSELAPEPDPAMRPDRDRSGPDRARQIAERLDRDESLFSSTLAPYVGARVPYVSRLEGESLYRTVRTARRAILGPTWTVLFADDADPAALRQSVKTARRGEGRVVVYLTPSVLFEPGGLADLDGAYAQYVEFEELRRELAGYDRVVAYEVAPGDRVEAVLSASQRRGTGARKGVT